MMLGTVSYTKQQLIVILNKPVGNGNHADASLILSRQLIPAMLNILNGTVAPQNVLNAIASANALVGAATIPMTIKPNTATGQQMVSLAGLLESFNSGSLTPGCIALRLIAENDENREEGFFESIAPNPFTSTTFIRYQLPVERKVTIAVYNYLGQPLTTLVNEIQAAGSYTVEFNADNLPVGVYTCRIQAGEYISTQKILLIK
jgi:hypothetical protein